MKLKLALITLAFLCVSFIEGHYTMLCKVYSITPTTTEMVSTVTVEDPTGNLWDFLYNGNPSKLSIGQDCKVLFNNQLTESDRTDDMVSDVWFK